MCWQTEQCADISNATIDDSNLLLNLITDESMFVKKISLGFFLIVLFFQSLRVKCCTFHGVFQLEGRGLAPVC